MLNITPEKGHHFASSGQPPNFRDDSPIGDNNNNNKEGCKNFDLSNNPQMA